MCVVDNITPGRLLLAKAGRDKGSVFVATEIRQDCVFIADGKRRKLEKPKRKNIKHISPASDIVIRLDGMTNKKLRKCLLQYRPNTAKELEQMGETAENLRKGD